MLPWSCWRFRFVFNPSRLFFPAGDEAGQGNGGTGAQQKFRVPSSEVYNELMVRIAFFLSRFGMYLGAIREVHASQKRGSARWLVHKSNVLGAAATNSNLSKNRFHCRFKPER